MVMDGAQEVERSRAAQAVYANVHTRAGRRVSFGEPADRTRMRAQGEYSQDFRLMSAARPGLQRYARAVKE